MLKAMGLSHQEITVVALKTLTALSTLTLLAACAGPGGFRGPHASPAHHPGAAPMAMQGSMDSMHAMRDKMRNAKTPEERQALMAAHMKAMEGGMSAMQGMQGRGMPMDPAQRQQMLEQRMDMMQTMMDMMMQRMQGAPAAPPVR